MRLLAFSDIHHNLVAVRKLRDCEKNRFDAIIVAGDIGNESAAEFFRIVASFECPVMYVYGNWDNKLDYESSFGSRCRLIHSNVVTIGNLSFTGFSGCPTDWGKNPIARTLYGGVQSKNKRLVEALKDKPRPADKVRHTQAYEKYLSDLRHAQGEILRRNRENIATAVKTAAVDPRRCIVIAHQRIPKLNDVLPEALLHVYGHLHSFSDRTFKTTRYVDVAALDRPVSARPRRQGKRERQKCPKFQPGKYIPKKKKIPPKNKKYCVGRSPDYPDWVAPGEC